MNKLRGFTLLEVLIALAILAISLTALLKATSEDIHDSVYLKDKTVAMMLAQNTLTQIQQGQVEAPYPPYFNTFNIEALKQVYYVRTSRLKTNDAYIDKIQLTVFLDKDAKKSIYSLQGFAKGQVQ